MLPIILSYIVSWVKKFVIVPHLVLHEKPLFDIICKNGGKNSKPVLYGLVYYLILQKTKTGFFCFFVCVPGVGGGVVLGWTSFKFSWVEQITPAPSILCEERNSCFRQEKKSDLSSKLVQHSLQEGTKHCVMEEKNPACQEWLKDF